jgi:hypothetical protein
VRTACDLTTPASPLGKPLRVPETPGLANGAQQPRLGLARRARSGGRRGRVKEAGRSTRPRLVAASEGRRPEGRRVRPASLSLSLSLVWPDAGTARPLFPEDPCVPLSAVLAADPSGRRHSAGPPAAAGLRWGPARLAPRAKQAQIQTPACPGPDAPSATARERQRFVCLGTLGAWGMACACGAAGGKGCRLGALPQRRRLWPPALRTAAGGGR